MAKKHGESGRPDQDAQGGEASGLPSDSVLGGQASGPGENRETDEALENGGPGVEEESSDQPGPKIQVETAAMQEQVPSLAYPVVGFGASAGGLKAFREILEQLDPETGMAFVLVSHLSPLHRSHLTEITDRFTRMPVVSVEDGMRPEPNHVYILLPGQLLRLRDGLFHVEERPSGTRGPLVIDTFFRSLAAEQKNHAIGVVLSGADSDGASGLKAIKGEGGIALVQTPTTADQPGMPRNSIAADHVDLVVPPSELAFELGRLGQQFARPEVRSLEAGIEPPDDEQSFSRILQMLRSSSGLELRQYKPETIRRRLARRLILLRKDNLAEYYRFLQVRPDELRALQEDVLINVTRFFRDPGFWESLQTNVLPAVTKDRLPERPIRVWCAGCSSGEEAYSLAITLLEYLSAHGLDLPIQVFGTDASDQSIEMARVAVYPDSLATEISPERLRRYFVKVDRGYQVSKRVRDSCIFAKQNLCNDPPFSHIDILSCRNVMIYFNQALQRQVMITFHYALEPEGFMLLGMSEGLRDYNDIFSTVDRKFKIYQKTGASLPYSYQVPRSYAAANGLVSSRPSLVPAENHVWPELELQRAADRIVLARFGPPGLIVDERLTVLQSRGQTGAYVELTPGGVSWNLLRVLKDGIADETRQAVQRTIRENIPTMARSSLIDEEKGEQTIQIDVLPITSGVARPRCFLVLFQTLTAGDKANRPELQPPPVLSDDERQRLVAQLRQDLSSTRLHLQSLVEERDARNQELVSANEEIQSANEELQSTNEELETTKEELQSANEELQTVNEELQQRNSTLTQTGNDLTNLLNSVNIPLLMLNSELQIRQFTPPMQRLLNVRAADVGRSISEIRLQLSVENIEPILQEVLDTLGTQEMEVQDRDGRWHLLRVRPYRTADNKIEGLVVLLLDIDQLRRSQQHLIEAHQFAAAVVESVPVPIVVADRDCSIRTANTAFRALVQTSVKELVGRSLPDLMKLHWDLEGMSERFDALLKHPESRFELEHTTVKGQRRVLLLNGQVLGRDGDSVLLLMIEDVTLRGEAERLIANQNRALEVEVRAAERTLYRTREELRGLTEHLLTMQEEVRERIARELHDDVSQRLSFLEIVLTGLREASGGAGATEKLETAIEALQSLNTDVRLMSHRLHPAILKDLGLTTALKALVEDFDQREGMPADFATHDLPESWPDAAALAIYRITQEGLRNVVKHAGRTHVKVVLSGEDKRLKLQIRDFGVGFDQESDHGTGGLGMISMHERARIAGGTFAVESALGRGTTITVSIPLDETQ